MPRLQPFVRAAIARSLDLGSLDEPDLQLFARSSSKQLQTICARLRWLINNNLKIFCPANSDCLAKLDIYAIKTRLEVNDPADLALLIVAVLELHAEAKMIKEECRENFWAVRLADF